MVCLCVPVYLCSKKKLFQRFFHFNFRFVLRYSNRKTTHQDTDNDNYNCIIVKLAMMMIAPDTTSLFTAKSYIIKYKMLCLLLSSCLLYFTYLFHLPRQPQSDLNNRSLLYERKTRTLKDIYFIKQNIHHYYFIFIINKYIDASLSVHLTFCIQSKCTEMRENEKI